MAYNYRLVNDDSKLNQPDLLRDVSKIRPHFLFIINQTYTTAKMPIYILN